MTDELKIVEVLAVFFLVLPLIRPLFKGLWPLSGLVWLPVLALGIIAALFPVYGFQPECLPLFLFALFYNIFRFPSLVSALKNPQNDEFLEQGPVFTILALLLLGGVAWTAFYFAPSQDKALISDGLTTVTVQDAGRGTELFIRVYHDYGHDGSGITGLGAASPEGERPLLILVPPALGSLGAVDQICGNLRDRGFTVVTYSRRDLDFPAFGENGPYRDFSLLRFINLCQAVFWGVELVPANALGRQFEEDRRGDIEFLLSYIARKPELLKPALAGTAGDCIFLAGYGAGGAAITLLASSPGFTARHSGVKGFITLEAPILSILEGEEEAGPGESPENFFFSIGWKLGQVFRFLKPRRITATGLVPRPAIPGLFIVSDRVGDRRDREGRYAGILKTLSQSPSLAVLAALDGAGPADYSDCPKKYPLITALFPGSADGVWKDDEFVMGTAALTANFAAMVLEQEQKQEQESKPEPAEGLEPAEEAAPSIFLRPLERSALKGVRLESGGPWIFGGPGDILQP